MTTFSTFVRKFPDLGRYLSSGVLLSRSPTNRGAPLYQVRRTAVAAVCALALAAAGLVLLPDTARAAKVGNPGSTFSLKVQSGSIRVGTPPDDNAFDFQDENRLPQCSDGSNNDGDQDTAVDTADPQCAAGSGHPKEDDDSETQPGYQAKLPIQMNNGTITGAGAVTFPQAGVSFPPSYLFVAASAASGGLISDFIVTINIVPIAAFTGTLNANTGDMTLRMQVRVNLSGGPLASGCTVNPIDMNMLMTGLTAPPGPNTPISGIPYDPGTGRVTMVNNSFAVPGASGCGTTAVVVNLNDQINSALALPKPAGANEARFEAEFTPRPTPGVNATFTTTPSTGPAPLNVAFNSAGSTTGATYQWDFTNNGSFDASGATTSFVYGAAGTYTARLKVTDGAGDAAETTRVVTVGANQPPTATDQAVSTAEDTAKPITLAGSDPEGQTLAFALASPAPAHGTLSGTAPNVTYTPALNYNGPDSFGFKVTDPFNNSDTGVVNVNVTPTNDAPVATNVSASTSEDNAVAVTLVASDLDGDSLTYSVVGSPAHGSLSGTAPNLTYTPALNYNGPDSFTFKATDPSLVDSNVATATLSVSSVNDPPTANPQSVTTNEDTALPITLTGSDIETPPTFSIVSTPAHGALSGSLPNLTYTPAANYNGPDAFVFKVIDGSAATDTATIDINVVSVNDAPTAAGTNVTTVADIPVTAHITAGDIDGDALTYTPTSPTAGGGTVSCIDADCTYSPAPGFFGTDSFDVTVDDGHGGSVTVSVGVSVSALNNHAPVVHDATYVVIEDNARSFTVDGSDEDGNTLTFSALTQPAAGHVSCSVAGACTFTPATNNTATQTFVVRAADDQGGAGDATITILVAPVNDVPTVAPTSASTAEDNASAIDLIATDVDADTLTWSVKQSPLHGALSCTTSGSCTYTPVANYHGNDSFDAEVNDGKGGRVRITVPVSITSVNDAPVAPTANVSVIEDGTRAFSLAGSDLDGDAISYSHSPSVLGSLSCSGAGACTFIAAPNATGTDTVAYTVSDGSSTTTGAIVIVIAPVNDAPTAGNLTITTNEDTPVSFTLPAADVDSGDPLTVTVSSTPGQGALSGVAPNLTYRPGTNANGTISFGYNVRDLAGASASGVVTIVVVPVNDAPIANSTSVTTPEDTAKAIAITGSDVEGAVTVAVTAAPTHGTYSSGIYAPALNYNGPDAIGFKVTDGGGQITLGTVSITVTPVNDPPVASNGSVTTTRTVAVPITLVATDVDNEPLTYTILTGPSRGTLSGVAPNLTYTPTGFLVGADVLTFKATDAAGLSSSKTVNITVNAGAALATAMTVAPATVTKPGGVLGSLQKYSYSNLKTTLKSVSGSIPVSGVTINFKVNTTTICSAKTNTAGVATCSGQGPRENSPTYTAVFPGNASYMATTGTGPLS